jgi:cytidine deaminase
VTRTSTVRSADIERLISAARAVRTLAYAPYSRYRVGAALLTRFGHVYAGCNIENASYGASLCAERAAVAMMVAAGEREPVACAVVTAGPRPGAPCGICRQVLFEFGARVARVASVASVANVRSLPIVMVAEDRRGKLIARKVVSLSALLPHAFQLPGDGSESVIK